MAKRDDVKVLIQNNIDLQKILVDLSSDVKRLTEELSILVGLFKEASRTLNDEKITKDMAAEDIKGIATKLDSLSEQNRTMAKGILLMESAVRENVDKRKEFSF